MHILKHYSNVTSYNFFRSRSQKIRRTIQPFQIPKILSSYLCDFPFPPIKKQPDVQYFSLYLSYFTGWLSPKYKIVVIKCI